MSEENTRKSRRQAKRTSYYEDDFEFGLDTDFVPTGKSKSRSKSKAKKENENKISKVSSKAQPKEKNEKINLNGSLENSIRKIDKSPSKNEKLIDEKTNANPSLIDREEPEISSSDEHDSKENNYNLDAPTIENKMISCPLCDEKVLIGQVLEDHIAEHRAKDSKRTILLCQICYKISTDASSHKRHMRIHSGDRRFKCDECDKTFLESSSLKRHKRCHADERPFVCDICFKGFRDSSSFSRHLKIHTEQPRTFQCDKCDKSFMDKHGLRRHEKTHTGLRPFECKICHKTFSEVCSFKRHQKIHSGERDFHCWKCGKSFLEKQSLRRHMRNVCGLGEDELDFDPDFGSPALDISSSVPSSVITNSSEILTNGFTLKNGQSDNSYKNSSLISTLNSNHTSESVTPVKASNFKDSPSFGSLINKDQFESISEMVEGIDTFEELMNLCGDGGQQTLDKALKPEPKPMPENLMCFECGDLLVDGENFSWEAKSSLGLTSAFKCYGCEEEDDKSVYGEPPVLCPILPDETGITKKEEMSDESDSNIEPNHEEMPTLEFEPQADIPPNRSNTKSVSSLPELEPEEENVPAQDTENRQSTSDSLQQALLEQSYNFLTYSAASLPYLFLPHYSSLLKSELTGTSSETGSKSLSQLDSADSSAAMSSAMSRLLAAQHSLSPAAMAVHPAFSSAFTAAALGANLTPPSEAQSKTSVHKDTSGQKITRHRCPICKKYFSNASSLKRHSLLHTDARPYVCPKCNKTFRDPSNCTKHVRNCPGPQVLKPDSNSNSNPSFFYNSTSFESTLDLSLSKHEVKTEPPSHRNSTESALADEPFTCNRCLLVFMDQTALDEHEKTCSAIHEDIQSSMCNDDELNDLDEIDSGTKISFGYDSIIDEDDSLLQVSFQPNNIELEGDDELSNISTDQAISDINHSVFSQNDITSNQEVLQDFPCHLCDKSYKDLVSLQKHMNYHTAANPNTTCSECGKSFFDSFGLKRHMRTHLDVRPHNCEHCLRGYCDNWSLKKHKIRGCIQSEVKGSLEGLYPCQRCDRIFCEEEYLEKHLKSHKGEAKFECDICKKKFSEAVNLKKHRRTHMAVCLGCDREFHDEEALKIHQKSECLANDPNLVLAETKEDGYTCKECGKVYATKAYLERHRKFHSDLKPYKCHICNKKFIESFGLKRHLKTHGFEADENLQFEQDNNEPSSQPLSPLPSHENTIKSKVSISIDVKKSVPMLNDVKKGSNGISIIACEVCGKIFPKRFLLARHMTVHSNRRAYECEFCGKTYKDSSSLRRHKLIHSGVKEYCCPNCGKDFYYQDRLRRHLKGICGKTAKLKVQGLIPFKSKKNNRTKRKKGLFSERVEKKLKPKYRNDKSVKVRAFCLKLKQKLKIKPKANRAVANGPWSCRHNLHCWRCGIRFISQERFSSHLKLHSHQRPFISQRSFFRYSKKIYLRSSKSLET